MALTERQEYKVEVIPPYRIIQIRRSDIIERDGVEIARSYHRHTVVPGDDVVNEPSIVEQIANAIWTPAVVQTYQDSLQG